MLESAGLPVPTSYHDLLNPAYRGLIAMPNPRTSSTGLIFLVSLVNAWGEDAAFAYFDDLAENIQQFTASGSGPANLIIQGETAIGLGLISNVMNAINERDFPMEYAFFEPGAPWLTGSNAIIRGREDRQAVRDVFELLVTRLIREDIEQFSPEQIFINQTVRVPNYPQNIPYANMDGIYDLVRRDRLLERWQY
jgi:iron(III) transport system substrate-binding protein